MYTAITASNCQIKVLTFCKGVCHFFWGGVGFGDGKTYIWAIHFMCCTLCVVRKCLNKYCLFMIQCAVRKYLFICECILVHMHVCTQLLLYMCMRTFLCLNVHITPSIDLSMFSFMITSMISICELFLKRLVSVKQFIALNLISCDSNTS